MKRLLGLLLVMVMVGCGGGAVAELEKLGAKIKRNSEGEVRSVSLSGNKKIGDSELVHLSGLTNLQYLHLQGTQITDAGLVHLKGMTNLEKLRLEDTQVTDAGVAELQKALPNCKITK